MKKAILLLTVAAFAVSFLYATSPHKPATPIIVANQSFLGQVGALPPTVIFTPIVPGQYRVQFYLEAFPSGNICSSIQWTDDFALNTSTPSCTTNYSAPDAVNNKVWPLYSIAGQAISISASPD